VLASNVSGAAGENDSTVSPSLPSRTVPWTVARTPVVQTHSISKRPKYDGEKYR
jgi:hypothetical protein